MKLDALNAYPHVRDRIKLFWGHPELEPYINSLGLQDRDGRQGFSPAAFSALQQILAVHRFLH